MFGSRFARRFSLWMAPAALLVSLAAPATAAPASPAPGFGGDDRYDYGRGPTLRVAFDNGFQDGSYVAQQDMYKRKAFQPYPRGKYVHCDRGYRGEYGDRYAYKERYTDGYRAGYERTFRRY